MPYTTPQDPRWDALLQAAWRARDHAYAPYSHFQVGAALLRKDGSIHAGCNVENASYGGTICAERNTICGATAQGMRPGDLVALVIVTEAETLTPPCGLCRQVIAEFAEELPILLANRHTRSLHHISELLPHAFTGRDLLDPA